MNAHQLQDFLLYIPFLFGQLLYILKRAGFSMRAGRAATRRAYIYQNWDVLVFRTGLALGIYGFIRHVTVGDLLGLFHIDLSSILWLKTTLYNPISNPLVIFFCGIGADSLIDWGVDWASRSPKVPVWIKNWLTENVAPIPNGSPQV